MGWFGKGKERGQSLEFRTVNRMEREGYFHMLRQQGWVEATGAFEFDKNWSTDKIRKSAQAYAQKIGAEILVEISDPTFSSNPYNDLVFYAFKRGFQARQGAAGQVNQQWSGQTQQAQPPSQYPHQGHPQGQWGAQPEYPRNSYGREVGENHRSQETQDSSRRKGRGTELFLKVHYDTFEDALIDCLSNISKILCMDPCPLPFTDDKMFIGRSITLGEGSYNHMGVRMMDLIIVNPETDVYHMYGNEGHDPHARRVNYMRDDLVIIKTEGLPRFNLLSDYEKLDETQKGDIAQALFSYLEYFLPKR